MILVRCIFGILVLALPSGAWAMSCAPHEKMLAFLKNQYGEEVIAHGVIKQNDVVVGIMETTVSHTGSWTTIGTGSDNKTCIFASGEDYGQQAFKPPGEGA